MDNYKIDVVVTRHSGLVQFLREEGLVDANVEVVSHASAADVEGRVVCGVLPHSLSRLTRLFVEIPLDIPAELRGCELNVDQVRQYAGLPVAYKVTTPSMPYAWACKGSVGMCADAARCLHPNGCKNCEA